MALFGIFGGGGDRAAKPHYSIEHLQYLYNKLQHIKETATDDQSRDTLVEVIRQITEALLWGEQNDHNQNFFDFFCEKNILADFVQVLGLPRMPKTVKVQLLQTLSMLVQNIRRDTSLYYLFSNNYINQLIAIQFDWIDEEILGYYISFLKSLALRLNGETVKFFFNERLNQFPLYVEAVRFFGHREQMVRTAIRTLTLQVYGVQDEAMQRFVLEHSWRTFFVHLACHLRELWIKLDTVRERVATGEDHSTLHLQEVIDQHQDLLMYISDIFGLGIEALSQALAERLLRYALYPVLLGSLLPRESAAALPETQDRLSMECALYMLHQVFECCGRARHLLEPLAVVLLLPQPPAPLAFCCLHSPPACPAATYRSTNSDVCGPSSAEAALVEPLEDGAPVGSPGNQGFCTLASHTTGCGAEAAEGGSTGSTVRKTFLGLLQGPGDTCVLLVAGILSACIAAVNREVLPQELLAQAGLAAPLALPPPLAGGGGGGAGGFAGDCCLIRDSGGGAEPLAREPLAPQVLPLLVRALDRHTMLRIVVVQALVRLALDMSAIVAPSALAPGIPGWGRAALDEARRALRSAARHTLSYFHGSLSDSILDIFSEEWEAHTAPIINLREVCNSINCLRSSIRVSSTSGCPAEWTFPSSHAEPQNAAKAIQCLLLVRRMHAALAAAAAAADASGSGAGLPVPSAGARARPPALDSYAPGTAAAGAVPTARSAMLDIESPIHVAEEVAEGFQEMRPFELGRLERMVCTVGAGRWYLILHPYLLLLVQPDVETPGRGLVRTLAPVRAMKSQIDTDLRVLKLSLRLTKNAPAPGEATPCDPGEAAEQRGGSVFYVLTLNFEDVKRCHCADMHLKARRKDVREALKQRLEAFIEGFCA